MSADRVRVPRVLALLVTILVASTTAPSVGVGAEPVAVTFYHDKGPLWSQRLERMGELSTQQIGIRIQPVAYGDTTAFQQAVRASLRARQGVGIFTWWTGYQLGSLVTEDNGALDVSSVWQKALQAGILPRQAAAFYSVRDRQYAIPATIAYWVVYYNKKVFDQHKLEPPKTWDDLMAIARTLRASNVTPFYETQVGRWPSFLWFEEFVARSNPNVYVKLMQGQASYTDTAVVDAMKLWKAMIEAGYFTTPDIPFDSNIDGIFAAGKVAMILGSTNIASRLRLAGLEPNRDFGIFVLPNINPRLAKRVLITEPAALAIPRNAPNVEASKRLAQWWLEAAAQQEWSKMLGNVPTNHLVKPVDPTMAALSDEIAAGKYQLLLRFWEATPRVVVENGVDEFARFMLHPDQYLDVLQTIQRTVSSVPAETWKLWSLTLKEP